MGRPSKSDAIRILESSKGRKDVREHQLYGAPVTTRPPKHLSKIAQKEWIRTTKELVKAGIITIADISLLEQYCEAYALWYRAKEALKSEPLSYITEKGVVQQNPNISVSMKSQQIMLKCLKELGMTPYSRVGLVAYQSEPDDDMARFIDAMNSVKSKKDLEELKNGN